MQFYRVNSGEGRTNLLGQSMIYFLIEIGISRLNRCRVRYLQTILIFYTYTTCSITVPKEPYIGFRVFIIFFSRKIKKFIRLY